MDQDMKYIGTGPTLFACLALFSAGPAMAAEDGTVLNSHLTIADPATLSGRRAESVYQVIRGALSENYTRSGDPAAAAYQNWRRYNSAPYRSRAHGERFLNNRDICILSFIINKLEIISHNFHTVRMQNVVCVPLSLLL